MALRFVYFFGVTRLSDCLGLFLQIFVCFSSEFCSFGIHGDQCWSIFRSNCLLFPPISAF